MKPVTPDSFTRPSKFDSSNVLGVRLHEQINWLQRSFKKLHCLWWLKVLGISLFFAVFFSLYFQVAQNTPNKSQVLPLLHLDTIIQFSPLWIWVYVSLFLYTSLPIALASSSQHLREYGVYTSGLCMVALCFYFFFPTHVDFDSSIFLNYESVVALKSIDIAGNAFPSLHVASALLTAYFLHNTLARDQAPLWTLGLNGLWCIAIIFSTLAIKQHVVLDVCGGMVLACVFCSTHLLLRQKSPRHQDA